MTDYMNVFDRVALRRHRERAAAKFADHDFLFREIAARLDDRLDDIDRDFPIALDLGSRGDAMRRLLSDRKRIGTVIRCGNFEPLTPGPGFPTLMADEEALPFATGGIDLVTSVLNLHWVNDLPGTLAQIRRALRPDGLFVAAMLGGDTLHELRRVMLEAEAEMEGGAGPRVSPFIELSDAGGLLQRAGFALPVADLDTITITWPDAFALMRDLRGMGETNSVHERRKGFTRRETLFAAANKYQELFADPGGRIPATFQIVYLTAWAPHESQQRPLRPGSSETSLAEALDGDEQSTGDQANPKG
jgi:NADH dehydrogenase [ubiquinone] 1 alpha subcomplex assembly factor 5